MSPDKQWLPPELPSFPAVATRLLELLSQEEAPAQRVLELIRTDPAFAARLLRLANSTLPPAAGEVSSVRQAVALVGLERVRALVLTVALGTYLRAALRPGVLRRCWRHSLACALLAEELAAACSLPDDAAYTAGLLHDIGRLGLLVAYPAEYSRLLVTAVQNSAHLLNRERQLLGLDHCEAGRCLMQEWRLPEAFQEIAARHHAPGPAAATDRLSLVRLACRLADAFGFAVISAPHPWTAQELLAGFPVEAERLRTRIASLIDALE